MRAHIAPGFALGLGLVFGLGLVAARPAAAGPDEPETLTPKALSARLEAKPAGEDAERLAKAVRDWFGKDALLQGAPPKVAALETAWAIEVPEITAAPRVVSDDGQFVLPLI